MSTGRRLATGNKLTVLCRSFPNLLFLLSIYFWHATCYLKTKAAKVAMTKRINEQMNKMTSVLWIDSVGTLNPRDLNAFKEQAIALVPACLTQVSEHDFMSADVVVVNVVGKSSALTDLLATLASCNLSLPVIARVPRDNFDLVIKTMRQGALTAVPDHKLDPMEWRQIFDAAEIKSNSSKSAYVFADPVSRNLLALAERVASVDVTVLLAGPTGSGKEVLARILHDASPRHEGPFIAFNCAAMPENLVEDMLFGHDKGSFTGATKVQPGLFEQAQGGTIFLDEIGEMSFHLQAKFLRILQERKFMRLGGQKMIDLDIRVIAATNRNLKDAIIERTFREDLYFRLSAFKLTIPPLRERTGDIVPLVEQFISQQSGQNLAMTFTPAAEQSLLAYPWPGNVRELHNVIIRAMVLAQQGPIDTEHLIFDDIPSMDSSDQGFTRNLATENTFATQPFYSDTASRETAASKPVDQLSDAIKSSEYKTISEALQASRSRDQAAEKLGISPRTLRHKLQRLREQGMPVTRAYAR
jgi:two-component system response regulator FlrC